MAKQKKKNRKTRVASKNSSAIQHESQKFESKFSSDSSSRFSRPEVVLCVVLFAAFLWSYLPVVNHLISQWIQIPDYTHGFLVVPVALYFLYSGKDTFPGKSRNISWNGLWLIVLAGVIRSIGAIYYLEALQGLSIPIWIAGAVWMLFGFHVFRWALPAIAFLVFMIPIPYTLETMLSQPLQRVSTIISLYSLQFLMQPAMAEGTTIVLGENTLEIERACSGLRIFFGIAALAYAFVLIYRRPMWTKLGLVFAILPIALLANSFRIVLTGLLFQIGLGEVADHVSHDMAGLVMVFVAAILFWLTLQYLDRLFPSVASVDLGSLARS